MTDLKISRQVEVEQKFASYPPIVRKRLDYLRNLIIQTASELDEVKEIEECLKWGEPSYNTKKGTPIRIDWKNKSPGQYAMYFSCQTQMVPTIRILYGDTFRFEKNRAIVLNMDDTIPQSTLKECIKLALKYHSLKHLPLLGE